MFSSSQGLAPTIAGNKITAQLGTIANGHSATLTIIVTPTAAGELYDMAGASSANVDPNTGNNFVIDGTAVNPVGLVIFGNASTATPIQGLPFVYGYTVINAGPTTAVNTGVTIALPASTAYLSSSISTGFTNHAAGSSMLTAIIGNLAPNSYATIFINVMPTATGALQSVGTVSTTSFNTNAAHNFAVISSTATNHPGSFALASANFAGFENAGSIPVTINRLNGTLGAIDVSYTTGGGNAVAGVNYTPVSGTIKFAAGQTSATINVPVKDDAKIDGNFAFAFSITGVDNGASLGSPAAALVTIVNADRDLTPPQVTSVVPVVAGNAIVAYVVDFSKPLDPTRASYASNYALFLSGRDAGTANAFIHVTPSYDPSHASVTLVPSQPVALNAFYGLVINGSNASGLTDTSGNLLSGDGSGAAGRDYVSLVGFGNALSYYDANNDRVNLVASGVELEVVRNLSGNAYDVQLYGNTGHAVLGGSVVGGATNIAEIDGLGPFGAVNANGLTTPPFFVSLSNFNAAMPVPQSIAAAVQTGNAVPNGPGYVLARLRAKAG